MKHQINIKLELTDLKLGDELYRGEKKEEKILPINRGYLHIDKPGFRIIKSNGLGEIQLYLSREEIQAIWEFVQKNP